MTTTLSGPWTDAETSGAFTDPGAPGRPRGFADAASVVTAPPAPGGTLVLGGPGAGKSRLLVELAVHRINSGLLEPSGLLLLAPTRAAAARLRDQLTSSLDRSLSTAPARTWGSYAFDLIRRAKIEGRMPHLSRPPRLLSGAEQDLIIKELLAGHGGEGAPAPAWPASLALALGTRGFRQEIRELFDRVSEYGASAEELHAWGLRFDRPDWSAAAALYQEYRDVLDLRMPEAFDPAGILTGARQLLEQDPEFLDEERARLKLILVDDYQEANPAVHALLGLLAQGSEAVITSCPDTAVQGFRGARPELTGRLEELLDAGQGLRTVVLPTSFTLHEHLLGAWRNVASRIATAGAGSAYRQLAGRPATEQVGQAGQGPAAGTGPTPPDAGSVPAGGTPGVEVHLVDSAFHEQRYLTQRILEAHLYDGRSFDDIAVIVRNGGQVQAVQRFLTAQGLAVNVPAAETAIRDEPAVRPLLDIFSVVVGATEITPELCVSLLTSRIGGASPLELRRLRQVLRREELTEGGGRTSDELLVELLSAPVPAGTLPREARPVQRIARMIEAGRNALAAAGDPESVVWALWSASGLSATWSAAAVAEGPSSARADRDLDAVLALFQAAERFVDQMPGAPAGLFLEYLLSQELPMDTLAPRAHRRASVSVLTPASAAGRHWPLVIVAGLQEGVWPNLRLRGELLGSGELRALLDHGASFRQHRDPLSLLQDIRFDELRTFSTAVSRATEQLLCIGVSSPDEQPSQFLDLVDPLPPGVDERARTEVQRPLTLRALVAELRKFVQEPVRSPALAAEAVLHLGRMAGVSPPVPGAHPSQWWGLLPLSSDGPVVPPDAAIPVSPSKVESVLRSPLNWFVSAAGGEPATDFARSLGTLVHQIAQDLPHASGGEYVAELQRRWPTLGMKENWEGKLDYRRAETMVRKLAAYIVDARQAGRSLVATEVDFTVDIPVPAGDNERTARLKGQIDRLEIDAAGRLVVVDLKTGKSAPAKAELGQHPQLAAYQAAVGEGGLLEAAGSDTPGGAALVQLGTTAKGASVQEQAPLEPGDTWAKDMIGQAALLMAAAEFDSVHDPGRSGFGGSGCRLPEICPLCAEGKQVTE
ncbi:ATP-dependent helicase [Arthrobacter sp. MSA 4-2]|uniref:ATP-dependent helicase n=1 Tax=Arthrobacter sp. MSA 4-2 TaxID=2794349 RepID=UPI0018E7DF11|nr:ATP-dependent DNA helicase [Arthrobacter sp. MSA 4-2]MBJ2121032.1 ATP-dependent helicase [Arthrobacter sp. MSA 4-2]